MASQAQIDAAKAVLAAALDAVDSTGKNVSTYNGALISASVANATALNAGLAAIRAVGIDTTQLVALMTGAGTAETSAGKEARRIANLIAALVPDPVVTPPPVTTPTAAFTIQRTGATFADFGSAHTAAQDGDTILVAPGTYAYTLQGWPITKALTVQSAVQGERYVMPITRQNGVIGAAISVDPVTRVNNTGNRARWSVTVKDCETFADGLTFVRGKCAFWLNVQSASAPLDFTMDNCYVHDWDEALECGNEYDEGDRTSTVTILNSVLKQCGGISSSDANHTIYVPLVASLTVRNTQIINQRGDGWADPVYVSGSINGPNYWPVGHLIKSRAKVTTIDGCTLVGSANSNCIDCDNCGDVSVTNTSMTQGQWSDGNALLSYGRFDDAGEPRADQGGKLITLDGRTNRLHVSGCAFVNDFNGLQQFIELSNRITQAGWTANGDAGSPPPVTWDISTGNTYTDNTGKAVLPSAGYPNLQPSQIFGIPMTPTGSNAPVAQQTPPPVTQPPATTPPTGTTTPMAEPAWYGNTVVGAWQSLPAPSIYSQVQTTVADRANPDDPLTYKAIYPFTGGDSAAYVTAGNQPWPLAGVAQKAGVDPIPGYLDFRGDQGAIPAYNATVARRGVTMPAAHWMFWFAQGGHGVGINNQILGYNWNTLRFYDITQQTIPPFGFPDANASAWGPDGRGGSTHGYNDGVHDPKRNRLLIPAGPGQTGGPSAHCVYCYDLTYDGWAGANPQSDPALGKDYFVANPAYPNGRSSCSFVDTDTDTLLNSYPNSPHANAVLVPTVSLVQGSAWQWAQFDFGNGTPDLGGASPAGFAMPGEPWYVYFSEVNPDHAVIMSKRYHNSNGRMVTWNVAFTPKNGDPANAIPHVVTDPTQFPNVDTNNNTRGIPATVVHGFDRREFYVVVYCGVAGLEPGAVFKVTPPAFDPHGADGSGSTFVTGLGTASPVVVPWVTEKIGQVPSSMFQLPTKGNSSGGWYPAHKTFMYLPAPMLGIVAMHDPSQPPEFFRLPA